MTMGSYIRPFVILYDCVDFAYHRSVMKLHGVVNRIKKRWRLGDQVQSILIVRMASIGDVVRSTAVVEVLKDKYPKARLDYLTSSLSVSVLDHNPHLANVYTPQQLEELPGYDWVIILQRTEPPRGFLQDGRTMQQIFDYLSNRVAYKLITGKHLEQGREICQTTAMYCHTEIEELFEIALLDYDLFRYPKTKIYLDAAPQAEVMTKFQLSPDRRYLGIFLGTNSEGGYDAGAKTYSLPYLDRVIRQFNDEFTIVMFGQSNVKTADELEYFEAMLARYPNIINLVDKTTLAELSYVINTFEAMVSCDSGPLHIGMALEVPVIGLFLNNAQFRVCPTLETDRYLLLNALAPGSKYSWRWKFDFSSDPEKEDTYYDRGPVHIKHKIDLVPVDALQKGVGKSGKTSMPIGKSAVSDHVAVGN